MNNKSSIEAIRRELQKFIIGSMPTVACFSVASSQQSDGNAFYLLKTMENGKILFAGYELGYRDWEEVPLSHLALWAESIYLNKNEKDKSWMEGLILSNVRNPYTNVGQWFNSIDLL